MRTTIILIRHGETAWNAERRLQGHIDIGLNQVGERQAIALAQALTDEPLAAVIASDLQRAHTTGLRLAERQGLALHSDRALRERCYGAFEGLLYADIAQRYPAEYALWQARDSDTVMPAGERVAESFRQFYQRSLAAISHWASRYQGQSIALVAHGGVLECAYRAARGMTLDSPRDFQIQNAGINRFGYADGVLSLMQWGEVKHLKALSMDSLE